jgi:hypothetical protein
MQPVVLFRNIDCPEEYQTCSKYFLTVENRVAIPQNSLVIGRYSVLPYYKELEKDLSLLNSKLINSYEQHRYVADIRIWYPDLKEFTPKTYSEWYGLQEGRYIVKGVTNSRKHLWNTHMFAENLESLYKVVNSCLDDTFIADQGVVVREFVSLKTFDIGINGLPVTEEYRTFWMGENFIGGGFYWSEHPDYEQPLPDDGLAFAQSMAKIVSQNINFFVIDIARTAEGNWIVVELNDGSMSGLSCIDEDTFYKNLKNTPPFGRGKERAHYEYASS